MDEYQIKFLFLAFCTKKKEKSVVERGGVKSEVKEIHD